MKAGPPDMLLEVSGLVSRYGRIEALKGIDLAVAEGELLALVGGNGAGKTTLLRAISGVQPAEGRVRFAGEDISAMPAARRVRAGIAQVPEGRQVWGPMPVEDNLALGGYTRSAAEVAEGIERAYAMFPILKEKRRQPAGTLSGGQQQMLAIARALMSKPRLLLLDEPSMGLAPLLVQEIFATVKRLKAAGTTIFLVEQNASAALAIADRGYVMETGRITMQDSGPALLADERVKAAYLGI